jgi:hypothetical protein
MTKDISAFNILILNKIIVCRIISTVEAKKAEKQLALI